MAGFRSIVDQVLVVEGLVMILVYTAKVAVGNLNNVVQLTANTAGGLCLMCSRGIKYNLHIGSSRWK